MAAPRAVCSISGRDVGLPISSSDVNRTCSRRCGRSPRSRSALQREVQHDDAALHVEAARSARHALGVDAERNAFERARRPDRVVVAQRDGVRSGLVVAFDGQSQVAAALRVARVDPLDRTELAEQRFQLVREAIQARPIVAGRLDVHQSTEQVDHLLAPRLELGANRGRDLGARHACNGARSASSTSSRTVLALMRSIVGVEAQPGPIPGHLDRPGVGADGRIDDVLAIRLVRARDVAGQA